MLALDPSAAAVCGCADEGSEEDEDEEAAASPAEEEDGEEEDVACLGLPLLPRSHAATLEAWHKRLATTGNVWFRM